MDVLVSLPNNKYAMPKIYYINKKHTDHSCLYVILGLSYGYQVLSEQATLCYKIQDEYDLEDTECVNPLDIF